MWTLAPGFLLSPFYKDTLALSSCFGARSTWWDQASDLGRPGAVFTKERAGGSRPSMRHAPNPVLITLEQTDACDYRCRCSGCAVGVGVWKFDEPCELLRQQRS